MSNGGSFADGFIVGWQSVMGAGAGIPGIPAHATPAGTTPYLHGIAKGVEAANKRKAENEKASKKPPHSN